MDWRRESAEELREYEAKKFAAQSIPQDLARLRQEAKRIGGAGSSTGPVKGGGSAWEDKQIDLICKKEKLETSLRQCREWVANVERGLAGLSAEEKLILDRFFMHPTKGNVDRLCQELGLEKSAVYERRDRALRHYTLRRYGVVEV